MQLAKQLKALRKERKFTKDAVAENLQVSVLEVSEWENGVSNN